MSTNTARAGAAHPQQITLPDSLMRAITLIAADRQAPPISILEAAILITFGYALYVRQDVIDPTEVAIPTRQWTTIGQALIDAPSRSGLDRVNLGLDWVNLGPASLDAPATQPAATPVKQWTEVPDYPVADWQRAVAAGTTRLGYADWVAGMRRVRKAAADGRGEADADG